MLVATCCYLLLDTCTFLNSASYLLFADCSLLLAFSYSLLFTLYLLLAICFLLLWSGGMPPPPPCLENKQTIYIFLIKAFLTTETSNKRHNMMGAIIKEKLVTPLAELSVMFLWTLLIIGRVLLDLTNHNTTSEATKRKELKSRSSLVPAVFSTGSGMDP